MNYNENEFAKDVIKEWLADYKSKSNDKYELNPNKCDNMNDIIAFCQKIEAEHNCKIIRFMMEPKYKQGYIQVLFDGELELSAEKSTLPEFINAISLCDGVNITTNPAGEEMFQITFFVDDLWIPIC